VIRLACEQCQSFDDHLKENNMGTTDPEIGHTVVANGLKTNYIEEGSGSPIILVHGSGPGVTGYANWRLTIPGLAKKFRVIAPDIAGFGYTERKPGVEYNLDFWVAHLIGFMDALEIEKAGFVGNSFGGALTLALAARHPERIDRFVLMGSAGTEFELTPGLDAVWGYQPSVERMRELVYSFAYDTAFITDELVRSRYEASIRPGFHETYSHIFAAPRQACIKMIATPEADIREIAHQALLIHGRDDNIVPLSASLRLHKLLKHADMHVFGECGHWTQIERKDRFVALVSDFFSR
jgi:2-hydroxymuconate-semialdehyde hydrolase